jgi:uncharacterized protein
MSSDNFSPPLPLRNPHLQTILASTRPRRLLVETRASDLLASSREIILDCGQGVRLLCTGCKSQGDSRGLAILIHGWEGSSSSSYMLSAAARLFGAGFTVFCLNLRDHGDSHGLNRELFNSTRLTEVIGAIGAIIDTQKPQPVFLGGFSLGGNFALRLGLQGPQSGVQLTAIAAICPLINPAKATARLEDKLPLYHHYFVKKWKRSLQKKLALYPDLDCADILLRCRSLRAMHDHFVPRHTDYPTTTAYFAAYTLTAAMLAPMAVPCHIIAADDDPITTTSDLDTIGRPPSLSFCRTRYGGHCGFIKDYALRSWADDELLRFFSEFSAR